MMYLSLLRWPYPACRAIQGRHMGRDFGLGLGHPPFRVPLPGRGMEAAGRRQPRR